MSEQSANKARTHCRLCNQLNREGMYCAECVPLTELRNDLNRHDPKKTNMMLLDFRAQNGLGIRSAANFANVDKSRWKTAETDPKKGLTRKVMSKIAGAVGIELETLFRGYAEISIGKVGGGGRIIGVIGTGETDPKKAAKPRAVHLPPGVNQHLISMDAREAEKAGYGHSYGRWRAATGG